MMYEKRAYRFFDMLDLGFEPRDYLFPDFEGEYYGNLDMKCWGKTPMALAAYITLDDGRKVKCNAWQNKDNYFGIADMPFDSRIRIVLEKNSKGRSCLVEASLVSENGGGNE